MPAGIIPVDPDIPRADPDLQTGELALLGQYLDYHRATLALKCARLSEADLKRRATPPSTLTLLSLVRHLTEVEYSWFCEWLDDQPDREVYFSEADPDGDFDDLDSHPVTDVRTAYDAQVAESRRILGTFTDGGELARRSPDRPGRPRNARWILAHLLEEYARHNGHADLLREAIDGEVGE